jgi:hypothetical protein
MVERLENSKEEIAWNEKKWKQYSVILLEGLIQNMISIRLVRDTDFRISRKISTHLLVIHVLQ